MFGNNNLSIVVLTQNILCNIIPVTKNIIVVIIKDKLNILDIKYATIIVSATSTIAIFAMR